MGRTVQKGRLFGFSVALSGCLFEPSVVDTRLVPDWVIQRSGKMAEVKLCAASPRTIHNYVRLLRELCHLNRGGMIPGSCGLAMLHQG